MHFSTISLFALAASSVSGLSFSDVPDCAKACASSLPAACGGNPSCICSDSAWLGSIACCVEDACDKDGLEKTLAFASQVCGYMGVDIGSPKCVKGLNKGIKGNTTLAEGKGVKGIVRARGL